MKTQPILVTGGAGFIGSHVVDRLVARGERVVVVDDLSSGHRRNLAHHLDAAEPSVRLVEADLAEGLRATLAPIEAELGPLTRTVHLGAQVSVMKSIDDPLEDLRVNGKGVVEVLEHARAVQSRKVVFASSAAVYGDTAVVPTPEDVGKAPLSPYGIDKLAGEHWLHMYAAVLGVPTSPLRFFNVYGPRQDPSSAYSGVISIFLDRSLRKAQLRIYGDGQQTRDFVYVGDVATAIVAALDHAEATPPCNVGTGHTVTVQQLAEAIQKVCGSDRAIEYAEARAGEIRDSQAVVDRLFEIFGVRAKTSLEEGLRQTAAWYADAQTV